MPINIQISYVFNIHLYMSLSLIEKDPEGCTTNGPSWLFSRKDIGLAWGKGETGGKR